MVCRIVDSSINTHHHLRVWLYVERALKVPDAEGGWHKTVFFEREFAVNAPRIVALRIERANECDSQIVEGGRRSTVVVKHETLIEHEVILSIVGRVAGAIYLFNDYLRARCGRLFKANVLYSRSRDNLFRSIFSRYDHVPGLRETACCQCCAGQQREN